MDTIKLSVHEREETGNGPARRLRAQGLIPGVSYSKGKETTVISVELDDLKAAMAHGHNVVLELDFGGSGKGAKGGAKGKNARYAVVKELQFHPIRRHLLHVDLHEVDLAVEIEALVAVEAVGIPAGTADGGIIEWERREVTVRALPANVPAIFEADVSGLRIGHHLTVEALTAPAGVTIVDDPEAVIVALIPPRVDQAAGAEGETAESGAMEPEVIGSSAASEKE